MPSPRVRAAKRSDLDTLVLHRRLMWVDIGGHSKEVLDAADPVYRRWLAARMKSGKCAAFIVEGGGRPVASGVLWVQETHPRPDWVGTQQGYLLSMFTEHAYRRRGYGAAIVDAAIAWAKERGLQRVTLHAAAAGRGVYEAAGFRRTHEMRLLLGGAPPPRAARRKR
jgi:GNAT superfamily N-acetyltransferase